MPKVFLLRYVILIFFLVGNSSCKEFKEVEVIGVENFKIKKISLEGIEADIKLKIKNPNSFGFSIYPSEFDVIFSSLNLGKAKLKKRVHIDSNCEKGYIFELNTSFTGMNLLDLTKLISGSNLGSLQVKGDLKVGKMWVKKKFPVDYNTRNYNMTR